MAVSYVAAGTTSTGAGGSRGPGLPAGATTDDFVIVSAGARTDAGTYAHPTAGWTELTGSPVRSGNKNTVQHFWKFHDGSESVSALTYTQGEDGANESQAAQYAAFSGVDQTNTFALGTAYTQTGVQDITWGEGVAVPDGAAVVYVGHKSDDWTGVTTFSGDGTGLTWNEIGEPDTTTGNDAGLVWGYALNSTGATVTLAGTGSVTVSSGAAANTLAYFIVLYPVGYTPGPTGYTLTADAGAFALTGQTAALRATRRIAADGASFALSGQTAGLKKGFVISALAGAFSVAGQSASLIYTPSGDPVLTAEAGTFTLSGQAATLRATRRLTAEGLAIVVTGQAAGLRPGWRVAATGGSFAVEGQAATLARGRRLTATGAAYSLSGLAVSLGATRRLSADAGAFSLTGATVSFTLDIIFAEPLAGSSATASGLSSTVVSAPGLTVIAVSAGSLSSVTGIIAPPLSSQEV
jgi:hypothetical protein